MKILPITQVILSLALIFAILLQHRGAGLSLTFGGTSNSYASRRGIEKILHYATIVLAGLFTLNSILFLVIR
ncbi:preprotein translocase subunit SecG [Candidatus Peregrinibacteria bacterium CG08_land_8_20_14_0_20_41_10]|nr:MAG: preprotein translocase subunit SecG [Candidatus Peregrinibacteria bacterium CG1_02_41_10]PIS32386.1 MAG: preprotein translocase subunit SecG [Candidatus Peregrinibacteria bacterium CG08_land_8_20_14_0_20_41_10]